MVNAGKYTSSMDAVGWGEATKVGDCLSRLWWWLLFSPTWPAGKYLLLEGNYQQVGGFPWAIAVFNVVFMGTGIELIELM